MSLKGPGLPSDAAAAGGVKEKWVLTCHQQEAIVAVVVVADHQQTDAPLHSTARYRVSHAQLRFIPLSKNELQSDLTTRTPPNISIGCLIRSLSVPHAAPQAEADRYCTQK